MRTVFSLADVGEFLNGHEVMVRAVPFREITDRINQGKIFVHVSPEEASRLEMFGVNVNSSPSVREEITLKPGDSLIGRADAGEHTPVHPFVEYYILPPNSPHRRNDCGNR